MVMRPCRCFFFSAFKIKILVVDLRFTFSLQYGEGIEGEGLHLVFTGEGIDGCKKTNTAA